MSRPGSRRRGGAALALAASLAVAPLLSGCEPTQAGAAAIVGDRRITVEQVQTATAELRGIVQDSSRISQNLVLGWLIADPYVARVATEQGRAVSRQDALTFFKQANFTAAGGGTTPSDASLEAVRTAYALQLLTGQNADPAVAQRAIDEVLAGLRSAGVRVSPRYGTFDYRWDPQNEAFPLSPRSPNWLRPAGPSPAPAPGGGSGGATPSPAG